MDVVTVETVSALLLLMAIAGAIVLGIVGWVAGVRRVDALAEDDNLIPVSLGKFLLMNIMTFGIYQVYWFHCLWRAFKRREESYIWPFWRGAFGVIWIYPLATRIRDVLGESRALRSGVMTLIVGGYIIATLLDGVSSWQDWPIEADLVLIIFSSSVLLPIVLAILRHGPGPEGANSFRRLNELNVGGLFLSLPIAAVIFGSSIGAIAAGEIRSGDELWDHHRVILYENSILNQTEKIESFYSPGFVTITEEGAFISDEGVTLYQLNDDDEYDIFFLAWDNITGVKIETKGDFFNDSLILVSGQDDDNWIRFSWTADNDADQEIVDRIGELMSGELGKPASATANEA